ncbi:MAG: 30S ribosomal protein S16 [Candidatus Peregrinibacteria bacterium]
MLKIRLQRIGRKNRPVYRIVVTEHTSSVKAAYLDLLGRYDTLVTPKVFSIDEKKLTEWIKKGAQPSSTLARLLKGKGVKNMESYIDPMPDRKKKEAGEAAPAATPATPVK